MPETREVCIWPRTAPEMDVESVGKSTEKGENVVGSTVVACAKVGEVTALQAVGKSPPSKTGPTP